MNQTLPVPRLSPLPADHTPELGEAFAAARKMLGFVPNAMLILQRKPAMVKAFMALAGTVLGPGGEVNSGFKELIAHVVSHAAGCQYCMAHTAGGALHKGVSADKLAAILEFQTSPLFTPAERAALACASAAASAPNAVTDELFAGLKQHWSEDQVVEIVAVISLFGFLNRFNDTMATPLEDEPLAVGRQHLVAQGWDPARHMRS